MKFLTILLVSIYPLVAFGASCDPALAPPTEDVQFIEPVKPNVPSGVKRTIGGTLFLDSDCKFRISNFTISPPGHDTYFYGIPKGQPTKENDFGAREFITVPRIVSFKLGSFNGQKVTFELDKNSDFPVGLNDLDGIGIWTESEGAMLGQALWVPQVDLYSDATNSFLFDVRMSLIAISAFLLFF